MQNEEGVRSERKTNPLSLLYCNVFDSSEVE